MVTYFILMVVCILMIHSTSYGSAVKDWYMHTILYIIRHISYSIYDGVIKWVILQHHTICHTIFYYAQQLQSCSVCASHWLKLTVAEGWVSTIKTPPKQHPGTVIVVATDSIIRWLNNFNSQYLILVFAISCSNFYNSNM